MNIQEELNNQLVNDFNYFQNLKL